MKNIKGVSASTIGNARSKSDIQNALSGCDKVFYIPPLFVYDEADIAINFVDESAKAGIKHFVMMTVTHPNMSTMPQHTQKLQAESHLVYKGLTDKLGYTILQPMHYMHNFSVPLVWSSNTYQCFYNKTTKLGYVDAKDVAEVAVKVLTEDGHENATYELVGTDFLSPVNMVDHFNRVAGRAAICEQVAVDDFIDYFGSAKYDSYFVKTFKLLSQTYSDYGIAGNSNVLTWLLGRKPTSFDEYIKREIQINQLA